MEIGPDTEGTLPPGQFVPPTPEQLAPLFPQLEILELVGKGGMGAVYRARQKQLDRIVALKILPPGVGENAAFAERFTREAKALAKLNHPSIVTLYEFGQASLSPRPKSQPLYYFLMEFVDGINLRRLLARARISAREALAIVPQICDALQFAHDQGIVHRDIKPENILMDRRGRVKVADFGLAKIVGAAGQGAENTGPAGRPPQAPAPDSLANAGGVVNTCLPNRSKPPARWIIARIFTHWGWCFTRCSPANCLARNLNRLPTRSASTCASMKSCCVRWRAIPSGATNRPAFSRHRWR
jgi:serine/threonine protein kinase